MHSPFCVMNFLCSHADQILPKLPATEKACFTMCSPGNFEVSYMGTSLSK